METRTTTRTVSLRSAEWEALHRLRLDLGAQTLSDVVAHLLRARRNVEALEKQAAELRGAVEGDHR